MGDRSVIDHQNLIITMFVMLGLLLVEAVVCELLVMVAWIAIRMRLRCSYDYGMYLQRVTLEHKCRLMDLRLALLMCSVALLLVVAL